MGNPRKSPTPLTPGAPASKVIPKSTRNRAQSVQVMVRIAYGDGTISAISGVPKFGPEELEQGLDEAAVREIVDGQVMAICNHIDALGVEGIYNATKAEVAERRSKQITEAKKNFARHRGVRLEDVVIRKGKPHVKPGAKPADGDGGRGSDNV